MYFLVTSKTSLMSCNTNQKEFTKRNKQKNRRLKPCFSQVMHFILVLVSHLNIPGLFYVLYYYNYIVFSHNYYLSVLYIFINKYIILYYNVPLNYVYKRKSIIKIERIAVECMATKEKPTLPEIKGLSLHFLQIIFGEHEGLTIVL